MKYLGIDFGTKKVGIAISDTSGTIAFPEDVWSNNDMLISRLAAFIEERGVSGLVIGDTKTGDGRDNTVTEHLNTFVETLHEHMRIPIYVVSEHGTTLAVSSARREGESRGDIQTQRTTFSEAQDAQAAALILQRFLDAHSA